MHASTLIAAVAGATSARAPALPMWGHVRCAWGWGITEQHALSWVFWARGLLWKVLQRMFAGTRSGTWSGAYVVLRPRRPCQEARQTACQLWAGIMATAAQRVLAFVLELPRTWWMSAMELLACHTFRVVASRLPCLSTRTAGRHAQIICHGKATPLRFAAGTVGYKLFAMILLGRLQEAGAEQRIWPTQFGFRTGKGCCDALFIARRLLEDAWSTDSGSLVFLSRDWAKAFDSINPDRMITALDWFGLPARFCNIIHQIYTDRRFRACVQGSCSQQRGQEAGISQGCPLSLFFFQC